MKDVLLVCTALVILVLFMLAVPFLNPLSLYLVLK